MNRKYAFGRLFLLLVLVWSRSFAWGGELDDLRSQGDAALVSSDYVTASYFYRRMLDSQEWKSYADKTGVLSQLGIIEESQGRFEQAAEYYAKTLEGVPPDPQNPAFLKVNYYSQRYIGCLERAGFYRRAVKECWKLFPKADEAYQVHLLMRIIENDAFLTLSREEIDNLYAIAIPKYRDALGWNLADLLRLQGDLSRSCGLYETLWPVFPAQARAQAAPMVEVYSAQNKLDDLLRRLSGLSKTGGDPYPFLLLLTDLLLKANRGKEALEAIESTLMNGEAKDPPTVAAEYIGHAPIELLDQWVDLVHLQRSSEEAIAILARIVKFLPLDFTRREKLSHLLFNAGKREEAVQLWKDWMNLQPANPLAAFKAAEKIFALGDQQTAAGILNERKDSTPPPLVSQEGETALRLGMYDRAFAVFDKASQANGFNPESLSYAILQFAETCADLKPLVAALVQLATGRPYAEVKEWVRRPLLELGARPPFRKDMEDIAQADDTGLCRIQLAQSALKQGDRDGAVVLLQAVASESLYRNAADRELAEILSGESGLDHQREAAQLMKPSLAPVLEATSVLPLDSLIADRLLRYAAVQLNAFQPGEALSAIRKVEQSSSTVNPPLSPEALDRLLFLRAKALVEFSSLEPAMQLLENIQFQPQRSEARFLLAQIHLALKDVEAARLLLQDIVDNSDDWRWANDALKILAAIEPLTGESLDLYSLSAMYRLQGRFADAVPVMRELAVKGYGEDIEEWARYDIGRLKRDAGDRAGASEEWRRLLLDVDNPAIRGMTQLELLQMSSPSGLRMEDATKYRQLLLDLPDTIFSDLARLEMQRINTAEKP
ncbi:MAG: tetratricopeptide repeat protein [Candidatus Omnitrophota bacterium]